MGLKVTKQIKVGETIECEGNFFYIDKQELKFGRKGKLSNRYFLRTFCKKDKIDELKLRLNLK